MLNINAHGNVRGDPYVTSEPFLPVILEQYIGSRWNLLHKTSLFMLIFSISTFSWPNTHFIPAPITKLYSCSSRAFCINYLNFHVYLLPMLQSWIRVPRSTPNYPRGSKWINMGIWGRETFVPGYHSIATVSQGWMNDIRKGMSTYEKSPGKLSISLILNRWNNGKYTESFGI
jgi:hypothetical protein